MHKTVTRPFQPGGEACIASCAAGLVHAHDYHNSLAVMVLAKASKGTSSKRGERLQPHRLCFMV